MSNALDTLQPQPDFDDQIDAGLRAFFAIMQQWQVSNEEAMTLLGKPSRATYYNWKKGKFARGGQNFDLATRLSYILGIYKALQILFQSPETADEWINKKNTVFGGQSALDRMLAGQITDLAAVRDYLDSVRGAW